MRKIKGLLIVVGLMVLASTSTWMYAQQMPRGLPKMLSPEDHLEILQLYGYYTRMTDAGAERDASWLYTEDGVWDVGRRRVVGAEALREYYLDAKRRHAIDRTRHFATTPVIVPSPEGARGSLYMMTVGRRTKGGPVEVTGYGKYEDWLVKTPKGWRFKERKWRADTFDGDTSPVLPSPYAFIDDDR